MAEPVKVGQLGERVLQIAEELSDGPYAEIFARRERVGWHQVGNEIGKLVAR